MRHAADLGAATSVRFVPITLTAAKVPNPSGDLAPPSQDGEIRHRNLRLLCARRKRPQSIRKFILAPRRLACSSIRFISSSSDMLSIADSSFPLTLVVSQNQPRWNKRSTMDTPC